MGARNELKKLRQDNHLTQEQVAKVINKTTTCYSYYETGRIEPEIKDFIVLADFYKITLDELIGREEAYFLDKSDLSSKQRALVEMV